LAEVAVLFVGTLVVAPKTWKKSEIENFANVYNEERIEQ